MGQYLVFRDRPPMHYHSPTSPPHLCCRKRIGCKSGLPFPFFFFFFFLFLTFTKLSLPLSFLHFPLSPFLPAFLPIRGVLHFLPSFLLQFLLCSYCPLFSSSPCPPPPFSPSDEEQTCRYSGKVVGGRGKVRGEGGESSSKKG